MRTTRNNWKTADPPSALCDDCGQSYARQAEALEVFYCNECFLNEPSFFDGVCRIAYEEQGGRHYGHSIRTWSQDAPLPSVLASTEPIRRREPGLPGERFHRGVRMATYADLLAAKRANSEGYIYPQSLQYLERAQTLLGRANPPTQEERRQCTDTGVIRSTDPQSANIALIQQYKEGKYTRKELTRATTIVFSPAWTQDIIQYELDSAPDGAEMQVNSDGVTELAIEERRSLNPRLAMDELKKAEGRVGASAAPTLRCGQ